MDFLHMRSPYDYTFNFWNDYLGLSTLVSKTHIRGPTCGPNSITESLKASLGLEDRCPADGPLESRCAPQVSIYALEERVSPSFSAYELRRQAPRAKPEPRVCVFCRNNGAPEEVYGTHVLKSADGRVLCPILRAYTCPLCSASGDGAHTIKYCPLSRDQAGQRASRAGRAWGKRLKMF